MNAPVPTLPSWLDRTLWPWPGRTVPTDDGTAGSTDMRIDDEVESSADAPSGVNGS